MKVGVNATAANVYCYPNDTNRLSMEATTSGGKYAWVSADALFGLRNVTNSTWVWSFDPGKVVNATKRIVAYEFNFGIVNAGVENNREINLSSFGFAKSPFVLNIQAARGQRCIYALDGPSSATKTKITFISYSITYTIDTGVIVFAEPM